MLDQLKASAIEYLSAHHVCILATLSAEGPWAAPVDYENDGLTVYLLLPRTGDETFHVETNPAVTLSVFDLAEEDQRQRLSRGLQYRGIARALTEEDLAQTPPGLRKLYATRERTAPGGWAIVRVTPRRLYLTDYRHGYGQRETLDV
ncbi:MAG: pyridoxamine 5'-phosphate oxidase family protein [Chloroflexi bacterium]|nr:pyridoxamine 5'-phosphate oxidase family protein [Chloroflexota bacterium]